MDAFIYSFRRTWYKCKVFTPHNNFERKVKFIEYHRKNELDDNIDKLRNVWW